MKKFVVILMLLAVSLGITAQNHLSFMGIPIEGSMESFCKKLEAKSFALIGSEKSVRLFYGEFTGRNVSVAVSATDNGQNVLGVVVLLTPSKDWNTLMTAYDYYKDLYTRKYGKPFGIKEDEIPRNYSNYTKMRKLRDGQLMYSSMWEVEGGEIELSIEKTPNHYDDEGMVRIIYRDSQNVEAKTQNDLDDI